jgi:hypothetical protein
MQNVSPLHIKTPIVDVIVYTHILPTHILTEQLPDDGSWVADSSQLSSSLIIHLG